MHREVPVDNLQNGCRRVSLTRNEGKMSIYTGSNEWMPDLRTNSSRMPLMNGKIYFLYYALKGEKFPRTAKSRTQGRALTVTHYPLAGSLGDVKIVRPPSKIRHVEGHIELPQAISRQSEGEKERESNTKKKKRRRTARGSCCLLTVSVRWSRFTEAKRRRSLQQNRRMLVISGDGKAAAAGGRRRRKSTTATTAASLRPPIPIGDRRSPHPLTVTETR